jgi:hypothetical protein
MVVVLSSGDAITVAAGLPGAADQLPAPAATTVDVLFVQFKLKGVAEIILLSALNSILSKKLPIVAPPTLDIAWKINRVTT